MVYITEIFTAHPLITPFDRFGINVPTTLLLDCVFLNAQAGVAVAISGKADSHD